MTLHIIGLGLKDADSITVEGKNKIDSCEVLYLETYTSLLTDATKEDLEREFGKKIISANREVVEVKVEDTILKDAKTLEVGFLVIGDVFSATTHIDLLTRAKEKNIDVSITHNVSVLTAIGDVGLELYKYGKTTSIPFGNENVTTPYDVYVNNSEMGMHTLFLLDLHPEEDEFMTAKEAVEYLLKQGLDEDALCISCSCLGGSKQIIQASKAKEVKVIEGKPQCLIIPGKLHFMEEEIIEKWKN